MSDLSFGLTLPQRGALFGATSVPEMLDLAREADANPSSTRSGLATV